MASLYENGGGREAYTGSSTGYISGSALFIPPSRGRHSMSGAALPGGVCLLMLTCGLPRAPGRGWAPTSTASVRSSPRRGSQGGRVSSGFLLQSSSGGRGFLNLTHSYLKCSALEAPGHCREGTGFFWSERLLESDLSICPSAGPSTHLSAPSTSPPIHSASTCGHTWTRQACLSRIAGWEGQLLQHQVILCNTNTRHYAKPSVYPAVLK